MERKINIWVTYHDDSLIEKYGLQNNDVYSLFKANDTSVSGENINYLNAFYCEMCTMYYVWKNNIKSKYVGFCHYRRMLNISKDSFELRMGQCLCQTPWILSESSMYEQDKKWHNIQILDEFLDIMREKFGYNNKYENDIYFSKEFINNMIFLMNWDDFCKMMEFIFGIIDDWRNNFNIHTFEDYWEYGRERYNGTNTLQYQERYVGFVMERIISAYLKCNFDKIFVNRGGKWERFNCLDANIQVMEDNSMIKENEYYPPLVINDNQDVEKLCPEGMIIKKPPHATIRIKRRVK
jgi:hypothetical protein